MALSYAQTAERGAPDKNRFTTSQARDLAIEWLSFSRLKRKMRRDSEYFRGGMLLKWNLPRTQIIC